MNKFPILGLPDHNIVGLRATVPKIVMLFVSPKNSAKIFCTRQICITAITFFLQQKTSLSIQVRSIFGILRLTIRDTSIILLNATSKRNNQ